MSQLPLNITPLLSYVPEQFVFHQGVKEAATACRALLQKACAPQDASTTLPTGRTFQILFIVGGPRSGKTHLSLVLSAQAVARGLYPHHIDATPTMSWAEQIPTRGVSSSDIFVVDNAHLYFSKLGAGNSGDFVSFVEKLRNATASLVLLSAVETDGFDCDAHVVSRLAAGRGPPLGPPNNEEMRAMVGSMARQRGIALSDRKLQYLERRLPRDIKQLEEYLDRVQFISYVTGKPVHFPILGDAF